MQATIDETVAAFGLKPGVTVADIWTDRFLPAAADRTVRAAA
jgi:NitT/TauT family transport system substrate-binding protein